VYAYIKLNLNFKTWCRLHKSRPNG